MRKVFISVAVAISTVPLFSAAAHGESKADQWKASAAAAQPNASPTPPGFAKNNDDVSGPFAGNAFFEFSINGCSFVYQQFDGTYVATSGGTGTLHIQGCADSADVVGGFEFIGLFTLVTPSGTTLSGTARGPVFPLDFTLTVTPDPGSGPHSTLGGTIDFTASGISGAITGALTGALQPGVPRHQQPTHPAQGAVNHQVSGDFFGSAFFEFGINGCSFVFEQFDGTYTASSGGTGTLHVEGCADFSDVPGGFSFVGTYTLVTPTGVTLTGDANGPLFPVDITLTVTSSSASGGKFNGTGTIEFTATGISNAITGTLTGALKPGG
jgi:hypothetical protein